jgi:hypothetical protein
VYCGEMPLPAPINDAYYFEFSAGSNTLEEFFWY